MLKTRRAVEADLPRLLEIEKAAFESRPIGARGFRDAFKFGMSLFVRVRDHEIVAFIQWSWQPDDRGTRCSLLRVNLIAVVPEERRRGHASSLLKRAIAEASRKHDFIELTSRKSNTGAHAFFAKHGLVRNTRMRGVYPDGEAMVHFKRRTS